MGVQAPGGLTSEVMLCSPQKSSISCVSLMPPIRLPATLLRPKISALVGSCSGCGGTPTVISLPSSFSRFCREGQTILCQAVRDYRDLAAHAQAEVITL